MSLGSPVFLLNKREEKNKKKLGSQIIRRHSAESLSHAGEGRYNGRDVGDVNTLWRLAAVRHSSRPFTVTRLTSFFRARRKGLPALRVAGNPLWISKAAMFDDAADDDV
jgi:hypothetical protein